MICLVVQDIVFQLQRLITAMSKYYTDCHSVLKETEVFPIEVDLTRGTFTYDTSQQFNDVPDDDDAEENGEEVKECEDVAKQNSVVTGDLISTG